MKQKMISQEIEVHPSTISRECSRNIAKRGIISGVYIATDAESKTEYRHQQKPKMVKFTQPMKDQAVQ